MSKSYRRRNRIGGQFAPRLIEMLESPAYRALSRAGHQVMSRIEIEFGHHGGMDNGKLPLTYNQLEEYGLHDHAIAPAIRELVALGFIEVAEQGQGGNAEFRRPSKYRITYRDKDRANPTHEWRRIKTDEEAILIAKEARQAVSRRRPKKQKAAGGKRAVSVAETTGENANFPVAETASTSPVAESASTFDTFGVVVGDAAADKTGQHSLTAGSTVGSVQ
jgi:hypothetical protein